MTTLSSLSNAGALALLYTVGIGLIAAAALLWHRRVLRTDRVASQWMATPGTILSAEVVVHGNSDGDDYEPQVRYAYTAGGLRREGAQLRIGPRRQMMSDRNMAEIAIQSYHPGAPVMVHYDPGRPERSVLELRASTAGLGPTLLFGCALLAAAIYVHITLVWP